jgi:hypothetical protein
MTTKSLLLAAVTTIGLTAASIGQTIPGYLPTNGLVGWWPFNGNANDESGNGNNGTFPFQFGPNFINDRNGIANAALGQNDVDSHVRTQNVITSSANNFTISLWAAPWYMDIVKQQGITGNEGSGTMALIHPSHGSNWGNQSTNAGVGINVGTNQIQIVEHTNLFIASPLVYSAQLSGWQHIVLVYDQHVPKLYVNGILVKVGFESTIQNVHPSSGYCNVYSQSGFGQSFAPNGNPVGLYVGSYDDIGIWNRVLTQQEIIGLYNGCSSIGITSQPSNVSQNIGSTAQFSVATGTGSTLQWQTDLGFGFQNLSNAGQYIGVTTNTLQISNLTLSNNNQMFRCILSSGSCSDTSNVAVLTVNNNAAINEFLQDNLFSVFPNPAQNFINIKADSKLVGSFYSILDNSGRIVLNGKITSETTTIDLDNLSEGIYMVSIAENKKQSFRVIKN